MTTREKVIAILTDKLKLKPEEVLKIDDSTMFRDNLGADSLDIAEIGVEIEDAFKITIPDEEMESDISIGDAVILVDRLLAQKE